MTERLLECLQLHANARGVVIVREEVVLRELSARPEVVTPALEKLERAGFVEILTPFPFLVAKLRKWSGGGWVAARIPAKTKAPSDHAYSHSKQLLQSQQLKDSYRSGSERGSVDEDLLHEILETLGETDAASFEKAVELYSPHVIRTALDRVRRARGIRKSRTALFRHLLPRLARADQQPD